MPASAAGDTTKDPTARVIITDTVALVPSADHTLNTALSWERGGFSGQLSLNYHNDYVDEYGDSALEDVYVAIRDAFDAAYGDQFTRVFEYYEHRRGREDVVDTPVGLLHPATGRKPPKSDHPGCVRCGAPRVWPGSVHRPRKAPRKAPLSTEFELVFE